MATALVPFQRVRVSGPSMTPTLHDGDVVIVWRGGSVRPGDVVLAAFRDLPERRVLKRAVRAAGDGWWLASDNAYAGGDSASHGAADVLGRVLLRWRPGSFLPLRGVRRCSR
ncbi:MAG: S24 family peptidase [Actinomycetota bacterium]|nr:S24 family peptidase [Actinomycetota bacterium]